MNRPPPPRPFKPANPPARFKQGDIVYIRAHVYAAESEIYGRKAVAVEAINLLGKSEGAVHYVPLDAIVTPAEVKRAIG